MKTKRKPHPPGYESWRSMVKRCTNKNHPSYVGYGSVGVRVCDRWLSGFAAFIEDMGPPPPGTSIDRINNDGHYDPSNCRWATSLQQHRNKRNNVVVDYLGDKICLAELAEKLGIKPNTIVRRYLNGCRGSELTRPLKYKVVQ